MRKVLNIFCFIFSLLLIVAVNIIIRDESKIKYSNESIKRLSLEQIESSETDDLDYITIRVNCKYMPLTVNNTLDKFASSEEVDEYRNKVKEVNSKYFLNVNNKIKDVLNIKGCFNVYVSKYAPVIEFNFYKNDFIKYAESVLDKISSYNDVKDIYVSGSYKENSKNTIYEPYIAASATALNMRDIYDNRTYDGTGIKIGMLETGIPDSDHDNFSTSNLIIRDEWYYSETVKDHATQIASIIAGNNGFANGCQLYCVELYGNPTSEIDWLLDHNVDVVNCSFGEAGNYGTYDDLSAYFDYITKTYGVLFVAAVGNRGTSDSLVTNPALGYNVLGVGGCNYTHGYYGGTSTVVNNGPSKPNVCSPSTIIGIPGYFVAVSGTSYGAAFATGMIALLMERFPALKVNTELLLAVLNSGCEEISLSTEGLDPNGYGEYQGAGRLNYEFSQASYRVTGLQLSYNSLTDNDDIVRTETHELFTDEILTVASCTLAFANGDKDDTYFPTTRINIYKGTNRTLVMSSYTSSDNTTYVRYTVPEDDYYTIEIEYMGCSRTISYPINIGFAFYIYTPGNY